MTKESLSERGGFLFFMGITVTVISSERDKKYSPLINGCHGNIYYLIANKIN